jgi:Carboxypeptidase regulatory-like domain
MGLPSVGSSRCASVSVPAPIPFSKGMIAMNRRLSMAVVCLFLCVPCFAQTLGTITGEVRDSSGAVVPGVTVTVVNKATNATRTASSNTSGLFDFPALQPGLYTVKSELDGFKTVTRDVELQVQGVARVNFTLEVGTISEMALVTAVAPLITTENATVGTVIENRRIIELPLNGRNYLQLVALSPNVSAEFADAGQAGSRQGGSRANQQLSISGQRREFNYFTLDGVDNTDVNFNTYIFLPSVDALEEFKVQTGVYSAEFGREASQVNVVTKSGTNSLHGTLFEFNRNDAFDARPYAFTASQAAAPKAPFKWNQYGYTAGGPVWKNKLFFMSNWEGYKDRKQFQNLYSVPSAAMRAGDFSQLLTGSGTINATTGQPTGVIVDPTQCTVTGTARVCAPFAGNIIPAGKLDAISQKLLEFYPAPNNGAAGGLVNNYLSLQNRQIDKNQYTQRIDFVQSSASTWMGRYSFGTEHEIAPALKLNGTKLTTRVHQVMVGNTRTLSSNVVNEFRFGFNYFFNTYGRELAFTRNVVKELGIPGLNADFPPEAWGIPSVGISNFSGFGDSTEGPYTNRNHVLEFIDNMSWIHGRHSFKVGANIRDDQFNQVGNQFARGNFQFQNNIATGYGFADFMLGYTQQDEVAVALAVTKFRAISQSYYMTDTWKVRSNMTFDLGLRYEYTPPWLDQNGTLATTSLPFHDTTPNVQDLSRHPVLVRIGSGDFYENTLLRFAGPHNVGTAADPFIVPAIQTARDGRLGGRLITDDKKNFAPRVGWAYNPTDKWSYRAGAGVFYLQDTGNPRFDMARNLSGRRRDNPTPLFPDLSLEAPFRGGTGSATNACGAAPPLVCLSDIYVLGNDPTRKTPYMVQYLFNIQRELDKSTALEIGYLGSRSYRLERMYDWNETIPGTTGSIQSRKPYPEYTKIQEIGNVAHGHYNSLAVKLTRRLNKGLSVLGGYTLSKSMDNGSGIRTLGGDTLFPQNSFCFSCEWGLSVFDVRNRFVASILYELPFGDGKPYMTSGLGSALLGGWQLSTIINKSSGFPRTVFTGLDNSQTGGGQDRPNVVSGQDPNSGPKTILQWFNKAAYVPNAVGTFGNAGRDTVIGPGIFRVDASIIRNFRMTSTKSVQFRLEAFNVLNNPIWSDPNATVTDPLYGQITSTRTPMREVQLGLKFIF